MSKGSKRRPRTIREDEEEQNWRRTFARRRVECLECGEPLGVDERELCDRCMERGFDDLARAEREEG